MARIKNYKLSKKKFSGKFDSKKIKTLNGLEIKPKNSFKNLLEVDKIKFVNENLIQKLVIKKMLTRMEKILTEFDDNDNPTPGDLKAILDEVERMRSVLRNKYAKFLEEGQIEDLMTYTNYLLQEVAVKAIEKEEYINKHQLEEYGIDEYQREGKSR